VRSEAATKSLIAAGARAHWGTIEDLESLRSGAAAADGVVHTAFFHAFSQPSLETRLHVMFGGSPTGIASRFMAAAVRADRRAIKTPLQPSRQRQASPSPHPPLEELGIQRPNHALASLIEILFLSSLERPQPGSDRTYR
jgi:hypothetical protein